MNTGRHLFLVEEGLAQLNFANMHYAPNPE